MKHLYTLLSFIFIVSFTSANPVITVVNNNGKWKTNSTWDLNRKPKDGDTVIIPAGFTVVVDNNINLSNATIYLKVAGTLELDGGKLRFDENSRIVVINGASIIAHGNNSEQIKIDNVFKYKGSDGMISGPAYADVTTGEAPNGFSATGTGALPVKFLGFNVAVQNKNVLIDWSTAQEVNSAYFEVQRSEDGSSWTTIATVIAAGNTNDIQTYSYTDRTVNSSVVYYRIRQADIDGKYIVTAVRSAKMQDNSTQVKISSGTNGSVYMHFSAQVKSNVSVKLVSLNGQVVYQTSLSKPFGQQIMSVSNNLHGMYVVSITDGEGLQQSGKVIL
ncbi:MAG TPA: T9SS type A sorting domain-containing protein [Chitinophagaceae bacterium]|nr:T9SS type A sorting domain-containing protein [Chitinophagaceae bacterium]